MAFCGLVLVEAINSQKYGNQMLKFIIHGLDLSLKTFSMIFRELQTTAVPLNCNVKHSFWYFNGSDQILYQFRHQE